MTPRQILVDQLASVLPPGGLTLVSSCCAESDLLIEAVALAGDALGDMRFSGIFVPGLNRATWEGGSQTRVITFFQTPELRNQKERVDFLPLSYGQISSLYQSARPTAVLLMCSPPDENGFCSFGAETAFIPDLWQSASVRIAHINPMMTRTQGSDGIPFRELTAFIEGEQALLGYAEAPGDPVIETIAVQAARFIEDGATLQTGLGKLPDCVLDQLHARRNLRLHTGLFGDGGLRLVRSGAMAPGKSAVVGVAIGSPALYAGLDHPALDFQPVSVTHDIARAGAAQHFVTVNSALEVDLFGQAYSEIGPAGAMSGPGGASDFAAAARLSENGVRIIALPASASKDRISRVIAPGTARGPVSLGRFDTDIIVTEYGSADLRGKSYEARARAMIAIAAPQFRETLEQAWADTSARL